MKLRGRERFAFFEGVKNNAITPRDILSRYRFQTHTECKRLPNEGGAPVKERDEKQGNIRDTRLFLTEDSCLRETFS